MEEGAAEAVEVGAGAAEGAAAEDNDSTAHHVIISGVPEWFLPFFFQNNKAL
jgi:hypothetical protein